jgi:hypothetical protein
MIKATAPSTNRKTLQRFPSPARLEKLIELATVDCYNDSEQLGGLFTMMEDELEVPFTTSVLGLECIVERVDLTVSEEIVAVCRRGRIRQNIPILDLILPDPRPAGSEWIDAYRQWRRPR